MRRAFRRGLALAAALVLVAGPGLAGDAVAGVAGTAAVLPDGWVAVRTGRDMALGFADPSATTLVVLTDITLHDSDWDGLPTPVVLQHNITIR
jgi:hypothetical protein